MVKVFGGPVLESTTARLCGLSDAFAGKLLAIIKPADPGEPTPKGRQTDPVRSAYLASQESAKVKEARLKRLGMAMHTLTVPPSISPALFSDWVRRLADDERVVGVVVQNPVPAPLAALLRAEPSPIPPHLDLDNVTGRSSLFLTSCVAEVVRRLVVPFLDAPTSVAVVGAGGFVGRGVVRALSGKQVKCEELDINDDKRLARGSQIVVSCTGKPGLLDESVLGPEHELVIDVGCWVEENEVVPERRFLGDVARPAYASVQRVTPVPGGVGPLQVATLLERVAAITSGTNVNEWTLNARSLPQSGY